MNYMKKVEQQVGNRRMAVTAWIYYNAILMMVLAVLHCVAAVLFMKKPAVTMLPQEWERIVLFLYLAAGVTVFFAAGLVLYSVGGLRRREAWAWDVSSRLAGLMVLIGGGAMVVMYDSPFAQLCLLFSLAVFVPLFWFRSTLDPRRYDQPVRI